jgi:HK97 gp10 family phage protein
MKTTIEKVWRGAEVKIQGNKVVNRSAFELGLIVEGQAKQLCPVNYGYLAASITTQSKTNGTHPGAPTSGGAPKGINPGPPPKMEIDKPGDDNEVLVGTGVFYAPYVEFGTYKTNSQPFLRPAFDLAKGKTLTIVQGQARIQFADYLVRPQ